MGQSPHDFSLPSARQARVARYRRPPSRRSAPPSPSTTSATSRRSGAASSPRPPTARSWPTTATSRGTWAATTSCSRGRTSTASTRRCSARRCSTWRYGLFEVVPGHIYQVRGFDLANISFVRSDTGWIVFDPLTAKETAAAAFALVNEHLGERPVVAVVYSHSHGDHFGGVRGVIDEADVASGKVPGHRARRLPRARRRRERVRRQRHEPPHVLPVRRPARPQSPFGHVDQAIGKNVAAARRAHRTDDRSSRTSRS